MDEVALTFADRKSRDICSSEAKAKRHLGTNSAKKLQRRVKELQTARSPEVLLEGPGTWHEIPHDWPGHYSGRLADGKTILAKPDVDASGAFVWLISCVGKCYKH